MRFAIFFSIFFSIAFGIQYVVFRRLSRIFNVAFNWKTLLVIVLLTANFVTVTMLSRKIWNMAVQVWYFLTVVYVGSVWILFSFLLLYALVQLFVPIPQKVSQYVVVTGAGLLIGYSLYNGRQIDVKDVRIQSEKVTKEISLVHLSDFHLGAVHGKNFIERVVTHTNALKPDIVIHTGDLFDGTGKVTKDMLQGLHEFQAPVFFVKGNHDNFLPAEEVDALLQATPFQVLRNEMYLHQGSLQIIGLDYLGRRSGDGVQPVLAKLAPENGYFTILLSHIPTDFLHTDGHPVDLLLAGHTHSGQIFPFYFLVNVFYPRIRGLYSKDDRHIYVSSGSATWGPPMRLGTDSEIAHIRIMPRTNMASQ